MEPGRIFYTYGHYSEGLFVREGSAGDVGAAQRPAYGPGRELGCGDTPDAGTGRAARGEVVSYAMAVTYICDNCGATAESDRTVSPEGWGGPYKWVYIMGDDRNCTDWCPTCVQASEAGKTRALADIRREGAGEAARKD